MTLRNKLIRLAHANPEIRAEILPLLKEAAQKIPLSSDKIRKAYYESGDSLIGLGEAVLEDPATSQDLNLRKAVREANLALSRVYKFLEPYAWD